MQAPRAYPLTKGIALATAIAWAAVSLFGVAEPASFLAGFIPARWSLPAPAGFVPFLFTPLTATLLHAGPMHLAFNLIALMVTGRMVEGVLGQRAMLLLYVIGAYASALAHLLFNAGSPMPMIGASGAISAVIGCYAQFFSTSEARAWGPFSAQGMRSLWLLAGWVGINWLMGIAGIFGMAPNIAIAAHIGGFLAGLLLAGPLLRARFSR